MNLKQRGDYVNLLEHHILKINKVEDISKLPQVKKIYGGKTVFRITLTTDCYGRTETTTNIWTEPEWKKIKKQGYFMA